MTLKDPKRIESLPCVPLRNEQLIPLLNHESIIEIWVPQDRPKKVTTRAGVHSGDVLSFWIEKESSLRRCVYESPDDSLGLAWYAAAENISENGDLDIYDSKDIILEDYRPLSDTVSGEALNDD